MAAGDLRLEVWRRPGAAVFERLVEQVPGPFNFTKRMAGGVGQGDMTVPATWDRINNVITRVPGTPSSDVRTLNRVLMEQASGAALVKYEWFNDTTGDESREDFTQIQGAGIESIMADGIVYPWDWDGLDESTSTFPDWIWGGKDVVGPIATTFAAHIYQVWNDGTSGTLEIGVSANGGAFQYATVDWNESGFNVEQAIEALTNVTAARVVGFGTAEQPWEIEILSPAATYTVAIGSTALGGGGVARLSVSQFGKLLPIGWTESRIGTTTTPHGVVTDFRASLGGGADPTLPAGCDAWVVFLGQEWYYPGVQKIVKVLPGGIYQVPPLWLYAQGASVDLRIVVRDLNENLLTAGGLPFNSFEEITIPSNTPTQTVGISDIRIPEGVTEVVFRIGHIGQGTPPRVFVACPEMREGLAPTTAGGIFDALFDDATVNHVGDGRVVWENLASAGTSFLDLTFTSVVDSDGVTWDEPELTFTAQRGKTYLQVLTDLNHLGYKWTVTPGTTGRWDVNLYNPTWVDVDATALATPAINVGSGVTAGPIFRSHMTGNVITVEGAQMQFGRSESALSIASIGRREAYQPDRTLLTPSMATLRAVEEVGSRLLSGLSVSVTVDPVNGPIPLLDYNTDWLVNVQIPPILTKSAHRLASITVNVGETTQYKLAFSSEAFTGAHGVMEGVRRLILKFEELERIPMEQMPPDVFPTPIGTGGGSAPTIVIAASNTSALTKPKADYVCNGTADQGTIQTALNDLATRGGGRILFCEGTYQISGTIYVSCHVKFEGMGKASTRLLASSGSSFSYMFNIIGGGGSSNVTFASFTMDGNKAQATSGHAIDTPGVGLFNNLTVTDMDIGNFSGVGIGWNRVGGATFITDSYIHENTSSGIVLLGEGFHVLSDCIIRANGGDGVDCTGSVITMTGCKVSQNTGDGLLIAGSLSGPHNLITGNQFYDNGGYGIDMHNVLFAGQNVINGNLCYSNGVHGMAVAGTDGHNVITGNLSWANTGAGIYVGINSQDVVGGIVSGNEVGQNGTYGIVIERTSQCSVSGNHVTSNSKTTDLGYAGVAVINNSNENFISGNKVYDTAGGNGQVYGIDIDNANCDNNVVSNNFISGSGRTADLNDVGTGTVVALTF